MNNATQRKLTCSLDALIMHAPLADVLAYAAAMAQREALEAGDEIVLTSVVEHATVRAENAEVLVFSSLA